MGKTRQAVGAQETALRILSRHDATVAEVAHRLAAKGFPPSEAADAVEALTRTGLLCDGRYARNYVELRLIHHPCGRALLRAELAGHGVDERLAAQVLDEVYPETDEPLYAEKAIAAHFSGDAPARKVASFLAGRGFGSTVLDRYWGL